MTHPQSLCDVAWNNAEPSWDCPCHGSRFTPSGGVINGPAIADLEPIEPSSWQRDTEFGSGFPPERGHPVRSQ